MIQLLAVLICAGLIYSATRFSPQIDDGREELNVFGGEDVLENTPPEYAFAIQAFGAFRSLIVNIAFIRAETFKEQGRYYDAMQLAAWICKLQPRFPSVWAFQAWNMAWNISVTTFTPEERWNWVYNGVKLLRDEGIPLNPRAVNLYKELAWIFHNKMGQTLDDFHWDYKRNWAWRMHLLLGPRVAALSEYRPGTDFEPVLFDVSDDPLAEKARTIARQHEERRQRRQAEEELVVRTTTPLDERMQALSAELEPELSNTPTELAQRAAYDFIKSIDEAPRSLPELYAEYPDAEQMVAELRGIGVVITDEPLSEEDYWYEGKLAERFFARYRQLVDTPSLIASISRDVQEPSEEAEAVERLDQIIGAREGRPAGRALVRFLQSKVLREVYRLDPAHMAYLVENFGPLDWRIVDAHSLYWATLGLIRGGDTPTSFQTDKVNTARLIFFSLRDLFNYNKVIFEPHPEGVYRSYIDFSRDPDFIEPMHRAFIAYGPMIDPDPGDASGAGSVFRTGHVNFLTEAIRMLYFSDRLDEAKYYYKYLRTHYGRKEYEGTVDERFTLPLRDFVLRTLYGNIEGMRETTGVVRSLLERAYSELAQENYTGYQQFVGKALELHQTYMEEKKEFRGLRMKLLPFGEMQINVFREWFTEMAYNPYVVIHKARLWRVAPLHLRQWVYDDLVPGLTRECDLWDFDVSRAFPEPPGMAQFREEHPRREALQEEKTADTPAQPPGGGD